MLRTSQIRQLDEYTIAHEPISSLHLMERASLRCVNWLRIHFNLNQQTFRFTIICGPGNNGGDGLVVARHLHQMGQEVQVFCVNSQKKLSPDNLENRKRLIHSGIVPYNELQLKPSIIIDAIFGSGFSGKAEGTFADAIQLINDSGMEIISIDIPSGLSADELGLPQGPVINATHTLTFHCPKRTFFFPQTGVFTGKWHVLDIDLISELNHDIATSEHLITPATLAPIMQPRTAQFAHKGTFGHALIVGGSKGKLGAADLAARAALNAGAGLVTLHAPSMAFASRSEIMIQLDKNETHVSVIPTPANWDAIGFGPGVGPHEDTARALKMLIQNWQKGLVIDADGLNILAENPTWLSFLPANTILTPHPKEFSRLVGNIENDNELYEKAVAFTVKFQVVLVLKGRHTMVCSPSGNVWFNPTGNPGMASAGMGDVLTGIITAYLANGLSPLNAALKGVYLHGKAGDLVLQRKNANNITAGDVIDCIATVQ